MSEINIKRRLLVAGTGVVGAAGVAATALPFIFSMNPSARAMAMGGPVQIDISKIQPGQQITVSWRQKPVWILRRPDNMLKVLDSNEMRQKLRDPDSLAESQQPAYIKAEYRSIHNDIFVAVGLCTHLGCIPTFRPDIAPADLGKNWQGGYFCPCHGSKYDLAGRVFKGVPAPLNLLIPPYHFKTPNVVVIGIPPSQKNV